MNLNDTKPNGDIHPAIVFICLWFWVVGFMSGYLAYPIGRLSLFR